jgi:hypothetical protein
MAITQCRQKNKCGLPGYATQFQNFVASINQSDTHGLLHVAEPALALVGSFGLCLFFDLPMTLILFLIPACLAASYQITYFGGKTGLIPFGRFVTLFAMLPALFFWNLTPLQLTICCLFITICMASAASLIFQYKIGTDHNFDHKTIHVNHVIGLLMTTLVIGGCVWIILSAVTLGSPELFAQRGRSRALLAQSLTFEPIILLLGMLFGWAIKMMKLSPTMVFGGILMPNYLTLGLLAGAAASTLTKQKEHYDPFFSGVFTGEALWILGALCLQLYF